MSTSDEMRRLVQAEFAVERERLRDRRWSRAQTIGTWVIALAALATLVLVHVL